jgi:hypothetical protein
MKIITGSRWLLCSVVWLLATSCLAQEVVFRASTLGVRKGGDTDEPYAFGNFQPAATLPFNYIFPKTCVMITFRSDPLAQCALSAATATNSFTVYRVDQIDSLLQGVDKQLALLKANVAELSSANDALTKRLNEMENKAAHVNAQNHYGKPGIRSCTINESLGSQERHRSNRGAEAVRFGAHAIKIAKPTA